MTKDMMTVKGLEPKYPQDTNYMEGFKNTKK